MWRCRLRPANAVVTGQVRSGVGAYAGAARRRVHLATVLLRPPSGHRPGRRQARHARILQIGLHLTQPRSVWAPPRHGPAPRISIRYSVRFVFQVFEATVSWIKFDPARCSNTPDLLAKVRLPLLTPQFLSDRVATEELIKNSLRCRLVQLLVP